MGLLDLLRIPRIGPGPLGHGVWRTVYLRFSRTVRRYRHVVDGVRSGPVRAELTEVADELAETLALAREACERAQAAAPSEGSDVPLGPGDVYLDVHRRIARAATLCSRAAESATMARIAARRRDEDGVRDHIDAARRTTKQVRELVEGALL